MGAFWSQADISKEVQETIDNTSKKVNQIQRSIYRPGCPGLSLADLNSTSRYRKTPVSSKYTLVDGGPVDAGTMTSVCTSIRRREAQKVHLIKTIMVALETYKNVLSLLIDGGYCATTPRAFDRSKKHWQAERYQNPQDPNSIYDESTCSGIYVPYMMAMTNDNGVAGQNAWNKVYKLTDRENVRWKSMVDSVRGDFKSGWRKLKKVLSNLLVDEVLTAADLIKFGKTIDNALKDIEESFQKFMQDALEDDMVRPMSVADVNEYRLQKTVESSELAAQKNIINKAGRESYDNMVSEANAKWHMPLSAAPATFLANNYYKQGH